MIQKIQKEKNLVKPNQTRRFHQQNTFLFTSIIITCNSIITIQIIADVNVYKPLTPKNHI